MSVQKSYSTNFSCNATGGWRHTIGNALRILADHIDHRQTLAIEFSSEPALTRRDHAACIRYGLKQMVWALSQETRTEALEQILREDRHGAPA